MEDFRSVVDTIKDWVYHCAYVVLIISIFSNIFPYIVIKIVSIAVLLFFAIDIITLIISVIGTFNAFNEGEAQILSVITCVLQVVVFLLHFIFLCMVQVD